MHGGGEGAHACSGRARTPTRTGARTPVGGAHPCGEGAHACGGRAWMLGGAHASGVGHARLRGKARTPTRRGARTSAGVGCAHLQGGGAHAPMWGRVVCASVRSSRPSVTSDKVHVRLIRVNVLLTLDRINLDLLCPRWLPHRCHIAATLNGRGCYGRIRLAEGCIRWWRGAYACRRGAYAGGGTHTLVGGAHTLVGGAHTPA
jgi:hypothetical protein